MCIRDSHGGHGLLLPDVTGEDSGVSSGASGVAFAVLDEAVAGDDDSGVDYGHLRVVFGDAVDDDGAALFPVFSEGFVSEAFAGEDLSLIHI